LQVLVMPIKRESHSRRFTAVSAYTLAPVSAAFRAGIPISQFALSEHTYTIDLPALACC